MLLLQCISHTVSSATTFDILQGANGMIDREGHFHYPSGAIGLPTLPLLSDCVLFNAYSQVKNSPKGSKGAACRIYICPFSRGRRWLSSADSH